MWLLPQWKKNFFLSIQTLQPTLGLHSSWNFAYEKTVTGQVEMTVSLSGPFCSFRDPPPLCPTVSLHLKLPFRFSFHQKFPSNPAFSKLMSIKSVMPSNHLILWGPLLLSPSIFLSIRVFSSESVLCIMWPKYWHFCFSIRPSSEYSGLISFGMDWLDLLVGQGTLKSLLQHHSSKASILQRSAFLIVQLSHPYMTTGKTIALTRWTFVGKVMSLLFNMPSRLVIAFYQRASIF